MNFHYHLPNVKIPQKHCCICGVFVGVLKSEALFWAADLVFVSYLTLTGGLYHIGLSSHRQICLSLLLNNSVDLFYCSTIPWRVKEYREQPFFPELQFIFPLPHLFFSVAPIYAEVTEPQLLKSSIPSLSPSSPGNPLCCSEGQIFDKSAEETVCF